MWQKIGLIYSKEAQLPTLHNIEDYIRIYFSRRNLKNQSEIYFIDVCAKNPQKIIFESEVIFGIGSRGTFDDSGVMPSYLEEKEGKYYLWYTGWNTNKGIVPYGHGIGVALWEKDKFIRIYDGPLYDRSIQDPFLCNSPFLIIKNEQKLIYYCSGTGWIEDFPTYGINIKSNYVNKICIPSNNCLAISRPTIIKIDNEYYMWYAYKEKNTNYCLGLSCSKDGFIWENINKPEFLIYSSFDWDSEMICYPAIDWKRKYMFYNGNGYGKTGVGLAIWKN